MGRYGGSLQGPQGQIRKNEATRPQIKEIKAQADAVLLSALEVCMIPTASFGRGSVSPVREAVGFRI
jgi:hypothetical protein